MEAHKDMQRFADAVYGACEAAVKAKLCPEQPVPSVSDMMIDNASATKAALRGSLVRGQIGRFFSTPSRPRARRCPQRYRLLILIEYSYSLSN